MKKVKIGALCKVIDAIRDTKREQAVEVYDGRTPRADRNRTGGTGSAA